MGNIFKTILKVIRWSKLPTFTGILFKNPKIPMWRIGLKFFLNAWTLVYRFLRKKVGLGIRILKYYCGSDQSEKFQIQIHDKVTFSHWCSVILIGGFSRVSTLQKIWLDQRARLQVPVPSTIFFNEIPTKIKFLPTKQRFLPTHKIEIPTYPRKWDSYLPTKKEVPYFTDTLISIDVPRRLFVTALQ